MTAVATAGLCRPLGAFQGRPLAPQSRSLLPSSGRSRQKPTHDARQASAPSSRQLRDGRLSAQSGNGLEISRTAAHATAERAAVPLAVTFSTILPGIPPAPSASARRRPVREGAQTNGSEVGHRRTSAARYAQLAPALLVVADVPCRYSRLRWSCSQDDQQVLRCPRHQQAEGLAPSATRAGCIMLRADSPPPAKSTIIHRATPMAACAPARNPRGPSSKAASAPSSAVHCPRR